MVEWLKKEQLQLWLREVFFFVPALLHRHNRPAASRWRAFVCLAAWVAAVASLVLHFVIGSSIYGWMGVCCFQVYFVVANGVCVYYFMEYREKVADASVVATTVNALLEVSVGLRAVQAAQTVALGAFWTAVVFIVPGLLVDLHRRRGGELYVDVTTLWRALGRMDDACKLRLAVDSVLFVWMLALFFIQLLQRLLS